MKKAPEANPLEDLRRRCEAYLEAVHREEYQFASGLKPETDLYDLEKTYADLASLQTIHLVGELLEKARGEEQSRLFQLLDFHIDQLMEAKVSRLQNRLYRLQGRSILKIQGTSLPFRRSQIALAAEPDRVVRLLIGSEQHRVFARFNPLLLEILRTTHATSKQLNSGGHVELCRRRIGVDLRALGEAAGRFLAETREPYLELLERVAKERLGLALDDLRREDQAYLLGGIEFDESFPAKAMISTAENLLRGMGLDPTARGRIAYDLEEREGKSHRACTYPIRVPDELVVSVRPRAGHGALRQFLQEVGLALHRSAIQPTLPFEYRCLGSPSVFLGSANLLGRLLLDRTWLSDQSGLRDPEPLLAWGALKETCLLRLLATQLKYELILHGDAAPEKQDAVFSDLFAEHCSIRFAPEAYLFFTDLHFYSARYLCGLLLESVLRRRLVERFGRKWFTRQETGGFLRDLWKGGGKLGLGDALERLGGAGLDFSPLVKDLRDLSV